MEAQAEASTASASLETQNTRYARGLTALEPKHVRVLVPGFLIGKTGDLYNLNPATNAAGEEEVRGLTHFKTVTLAVFPRRNPAGPTYEESLAAIPVELRPYVDAIEHPTPNFYMRSHGVDGLLREHFRLKLYRQLEDTVS